MGNIISQQKRSGEQDIIDGMEMKQVYGSDYPSKVISKPIEIPMYVDPMITSKSTEPSVDLEGEISINESRHLSK